MTKRVGTCAQCHQKVELTPGWHRTKPHYPPSFGWIGSVPHCTGSGMPPKEYHARTLVIEPPIGVRETLEAITEIADGRRHYSDGGLEALGEIAELAAKSMETTPLDCLGRFMHSWGSWMHDPDGESQYSRECTRMGCPARQKAEDLEPTGRTETENKKDDEPE